MASRVTRSSKGLDPELFAPASVSSTSNSTNFNKNAPSYSSTVASAGAVITSTVPFKPPSSGIDSRVGTNSSIAVYDQSNNTSVTASSVGTRTHSTQNFATIQLEHISGYTGKGKNTIHAHPMNPDTYITW
jgi:hypothetical protein